MRLTHTFNMAAATGRLSYGLRVVSVLVPALLFATVPVSVNPADRSVPVINLWQGLSVTPHEHKDTSIVLAADDIDRPWLAEAIARHPDTEQWRAQAAAHRAQPRTPGWVKYEAFALSQQRDVLSMPTFLQMAAADRRPGHLLVRLESQADPATLADMGLLHVRSLTDSMPSLSLHLYKISEHLSFLDAIEAANAHANVIYAEPDYSIQPLDGEAEPTPASPAAH